MSRYCITRHINSVVLNPKEFVLTRTGRVKWFKTRKNARMFLVKAGIPIYDIICQKGIYIENMEDMG